MSEDNQSIAALETRYYDWVEKASSPYFIQLYSAVEMHRHIFRNRDDIIVVTFEIRDASVLDSDPERRVFQAVAIVEYTLLKYRETYLARYFSEDTLFNVMPGIRNLLLVEKVINQQLKTSAFDIAILVETDTESINLRFGKLSRTGIEDGSVFDQFASTIIHPIGELSKGEKHV